MRASRKRKHNEKRNAKNYLEKRLSDIAVSSYDRKRSHEDVQKLLNEMTELLCDNSIFSRVFRKSGSCASSTKIKRADEFDYDLPIKSPDSYRVEIVEDQNHTAINARVFSGDNQLTPSMIQQRLYNFMLVGASSLDSCYQMSSQRRREFEWRRCRISVDGELHGPAVTMRMSIPNFHDISVDISPSLKTNEVTLRDYRWPRDKTRQVLQAEVIEEIQSVGLHVVPKGKDLWKFSVSRAERVLMSRIDHDNGCRKKCHKLLKSDFDEWNKRYNLDGISTFLFKCTELTYSRQLILFDVVLKIFLVYANPV
ncbi:protein mab-21-like 3 isoform X2 [Hydractinia symbiolongicarpus]|uniref:protein mab-21-like 3 isoform X2 n=1 Tax=Hydractinia symbiolongicarpus TaxID=13093 RepID=UPI00254BEFD3|nr:protein mab-21-like 3 isoform X2 [Hydractinia symbiolongicarpus]